MNQDFFDFVRNVRSAMDACDTLRLDERIDFDLRMGVSAAAGYLSSELGMLRRRIARECAPWFESPTANSEGSAGTAK